jgi:hypothetical protein
MIGRQMNRSHSGKPYMTQKRLSNLNLEYSMWERQVFKDDSRKNLTPNKILFYTYDIHGKIKCC